MQQIATSNSALTDSELRQSGERVNPQTQDVRKGCCCKQHDANNMIGHCSLNLNFQA